LNAVLESKVLAKQARLFAALAALACSIDVDDLGAGKACSPDGRCSAGYHCNAERRCVAALENEAAAGSAGTVDGGRGGTDRGGSSGSGQGGTSADAGHEAERESGSGGTSADAAAPDGGTPISDASCASPARYYADGDRDGFGRDDSTQWACTSPGDSWATRGGDCNDSDDRVFPGQPAFFGTGYAHAGADSFDYDCNGSEQPDPSQQGPAPNCGDLGLGDCSGSGFEPSERTGPELDPICGSTSRVECTPALLVCGTRTSTTQPKRCH
jgi:hypothetical protein